MVKLYEISKDYIGFLNSDITGDELTECLDSIEGAFNEKAGNVLAVLATLDSDVSVIDEQIKRLSSLKKSIVGNNDRLKEYLRYNMEMSGITKIEHPFFKATLGKPSQVVNVVDQDLLPDEFVNVVTTVKPDLNAIKEALKEGEVSGAMLVTGKSRLTIR